MMEAVTEVRDMNCKQKGPMQQKTTALQKIDGLHIEDKLTGVQWFVVFFFFLKNDEELVGKEKKENNTSSSPMTIITQPPPTTTQVHSSSPPARRLHPLVGNICEKKKGCQWEKE